VKYINDSDGAVLVIVALVIVVLIGVTAFAIDFGIVFTTQKQLQNASDAGALAGARALGYYRCVESGNTNCTTVNGVNITGTESEAVVQNVVAAVGDNSAFDTSSLNVDSNTDIKLGKWSEASNPKFTPDVSPVNAVKVTTRKEAGTDNGSVRAFFGQIFSVNEYNTAKESIAAITGLSIAPPGELIPIGVSVAGCPAPEIRMQKTTESCVGWTTLDPVIDPTPGSVSAIIDGIRTGASSTPELKVGTPIQFGGGVVTPIFESFYKLYDSKKDASGHWQVLVPVYNESEVCGNPNQTLTIVGFATVDITCADYKGGPEVRPDCDLSDSQPHENIIRGTMQCNKIQEGAGGGGDYGTLGTIPGLVQ
jgi:Flp pilus assembly protein TadG